MIYVGIDYSINHTSICIDNKGDLSYYIITRGSRLSKQQKKVIADLEDTKFLQNFYLIKHEKNVNYNLEENSKLTDAINITEIIFLNILKKYDITNIKVGIEGFSYGSVSMRNFDIVGYQYLLRNMLRQNNIDFKIFSPSEIKKVAGKGNYSKGEMVMAYLNYYTKDIIRLIKLSDMGELKGLKVWQYLKDNFSDITKTSKVIEPISGICDSFWTMKTTEKYF